LKPDGVLYVVEVARFDHDYLAASVVDQLIRASAFQPSKITRVWPAYVMTCQMDPG